MLSLEAFVVSHDSDEDDFEKATSLALTLDRTDFVPDAYRVNSVEFPHVSKGQKSGSKDEEADEEVGVHGDPGAMDSGPSQVPKPSARTQISTLRALLRLTLKARGVPKPDFYLIPVGSSCPLDILRFPVLGLWIFRVVGLLPLLC